MKFLKWLGIGLAACVVALIALPWLPAVQDAFGTREYRDWLEANRTPIETQGETAFPALPREFDKAHFTMLSEIHGFQTVQQVEFALLKRLNAQSGVRTYLGEMSPAQAMAFNVMVSGGSDGAARQVFDIWADQSAQWGNKEFFAKLQKVAELNASLPPERQVHFIGVDKLTDEAFAQSMLASLKTEAEPGFDTLDGVQAINASLLREALERDPKDSRYKNITTNITKLVTMPGGAEEHFYGLWGIFHGSKATINGAEPLARLLDKPDAPFAGSVVSIGTLCLEDCANLMPARALPSVLNGSAGEEYTIMPLAYDNPYLSRVRGVNDLKAVMGDDTLDMFRLSGDASPYHSGPRLTESSGILALMQPFHYGASAADVLDYVVAIRTSKPLTPWKGKAAEAPI